MKFFERLPLNPSTSRIDQLHTVQSKNILERGSEKEKKHTYHRKSINRPGSLFI